MLKNSRIPRIVSLLVAAAVLVAAPAFGRTSDPGTDLAKIDPQLQQRLAAASDNEHLAVFVLAQDVKTARSAVASSGMRLADTFDKVGTAIAEGTPSQIAKASRFPGVEYVELNAPVRLMLDTALKATRSEDAHTGFTEGNQTSTGVDGTGISIAVIDTGIDGTHPFFQQDGESKVVKNLKLACPFFYACRGSDGDQLDEVFVDFTNTTNDTDTPSAGGHGTHVAGIAAGVPVTVGGKVIHGAAPGAKLVGLSAGQGLSVYGGFAGLNWVLEHHAAPCGTGVSATDCPPIKVINNSYGGTGEWNPNGVEAKLQTALLAAGVNVVWAAGNGDDLNNGGDGSDNRLGDDSQHPGPGIIAVANYDDQGTGTRDGALSSSSSRGEKGRPATYPDVSAPGTDILSACRPQLISCNLGTDRLRDYAEASGTSMASPLVAGIVAQLRQAGPSLTPGDIENIIQDTAYKFTAGAPYEPDPQNLDGTTSFDKGAGLIDAKAAVAKIRGITLPEETPPPPSSGGLSCTETGPVYSDPKGDARSLGLTNMTDNMPALDLREGRLAWDAVAGKLTITMGVLDLPEVNPETSPNISFNFNFSYNGGKYSVEAYRGSGGELFRFGELVDADLATARIHRSAITGSFDAQNDVVTLILTNADLATRGIKAFEGGDVLKDLEAVSRRAVNAGATTAGPASDSTDASCPYTLGLGAILPPSEGGGFDGSVSSTSQRYDFSGTILADALLPLTGTNASLCDGGAANKNCESRKVKVTLPAGGANLKFTVKTPQPNSLILYVWGPDGKKFGEGTGLSNSQTVSKAATESGIYTLVLRPWVAVNLKYSGYVHLGSEPAPGPDATISSSNPSYSWGRGPITDSTFVFGCSGMSQYSCDTRLIDIAIPAGGGTLTFTLDSDLADVNDFDLYVFDPDGTQFGSIAVEGSHGAFSKAATKSGVYRVVVQAFLTVESSYQASVKLS